MINNNGNAQLEIKETCRHLLITWLGGCRLDCDDCEYGAQGNDICYLLYCFFQTIIDNTEMKSKLEILRARQAKKKRQIPPPKKQEEFYALCSNPKCTYSETVFCIDGKLVATKKFMQGTNGKIYHICSDGRPSLCKLK